QNIPILFIGTLRKINKKGYWKSPGGKQNIVFGLKWQTIEMANGLAKASQSSKKKLKSVLLKFEARSLLIGLLYSNSKLWLRGEIYLRQMRHRFLHSFCWVIIIFKFPMQVRFVCCH